MNEHPARYRLIVSDKVVNLGSYADTLAGLADKGEVINTVPNYNGIGFGMILIDVNGDDSEHAEVERAINADSRVTEYWTMPL